MCLPFNLKGTSGACEKSPEGLSGKGQEIPRDRKIVNFDVQQHTLDGALLLRPVYGEPNLSQSSRCGRILIYMSGHEASCPHQRGI
jgi:hypothetical protein